MGSRLLPGLFKMEHVQLCSEKGMATESWFSMATMNIEANTMTSHLALAGTAGPVQFTISIIPQLFPSAQLKAMR